MIRYTAYIIFNQYHPEHQNLPNEQWPTFIRKNLDSVPSLKDGNKIFDYHEKLRLIHNKESIFNNYADTYYFKVTKIIKMKV